jgi:Domain of unknown function (DUF929)
MASSVPPRSSSSTSRRPSTRQAASRRRRNRNLAIATSTAVIVALAALVGARVLIGPSTTGHGAAGYSTGPAPAEVVNAVTGMPLSQLVGAGAKTPTVAPTPVSGPSLCLDGKPEVLYIGAEFCPFCAAQRWAVVAALAHFGTWSGLQIIHSSSTDAYPDTPSLSFRTATYTSPYLTFQGVEETTNQSCKPGSANCASNGYQVLDRTTAGEEEILATYDRGESIPFVDFGGAAVLVGASYDPQVLAGQTPEQVAKCLTEPSTADAKQIGAAAAAITRTLCHITSEQPARTCTQSEA